MSISDSVHCNRDAGVVLVAYFCNFIKKEKSTALLTRLSSKARNLHVLELGTGCGIVGLEIHRLYPDGTVTLTDLPEAMTILGYNTDLVPSRPNRGQVITMVLDWEAPLPEAVKSHQQDLIIVSDCTYNPDSVPALVQTLKALIDISSNAFVVVSMKTRHDSEAVFFDLMTCASLKCLERTVIQLPDQSRSDAGQDLEIAEIYVYSKSDK